MQFNKIAITIVHNVEQYWMRLQEKKKFGHIKTSLVGMARDHLVFPLADDGRVPCASSFANTSFCSSGVFLMLGIGPSACEKRLKGTAHTSSEQIKASLPAPGSF